MIKAKLIKPIFTNEGKADDNGFRIYLYRCLKDDEETMEKGKTFKAAGYYMPALTSCSYLLTGKWAKDKKYGRQFQISSCEEVNISKEQGIKLFLSSYMVQGVGKVLANRIYDIFGDDTFDVMDHDIDRLLEVKGITRSKLELIKKSYMANRGIRKLITMLAPYDIPISVAQRVADKYKDQACLICQTHPYLLTGIRGIGFPTADRIGKAMHVDLNSAERIRSAVEYALIQIEQGGSCYATEATLLPAVQKLLTDCTVQTPDIQRVISDMIQKEELMYTANLFSRRKMYDAESEVAKNIIRLLHAQRYAIPDLDKKIRDWEAASGLSLHPQQALAVKTALSYNFSVITGGPGRGKTTIANAIVALRKQYGRRKTVCLLSPTGCAAKKLMESTGVPAKTIHSRLQLYDSENFLPGDNCIDDETIIIDETSMLDIWVANALLSSIQSGSQVVFIGDIDQLPSVGPGAVLRDIISSQVIPVVELTQIFRQKGNNLIVTNAEKIKNGDPQLAYDDSSFQIYQTDDFEMSARYMIALYQKYVAKYGKNEVVCLTPHHHAATASSVDMMNKYLQYTINPADQKKPQLSYRKQIFRIGDLVMQIRNTEHAVNGDIGVIKEVKKEDGMESLTVVFENNTVEYSGEDLGQLELGYAMSIHKSQGSEYKCVILNLLTGHGNMLKRNLIYTAITRAKKECILVSNADAITKAVCTTEKNARLTLLTAKIRILHRKEFEDNPFEQD